jgi:lactoylglutathione lyase
VKLTLLVLRTPKLEDLKKFYSALGLGFKSERHGNGPDHYAAMLDDDLVVELYPCLDGTPRDPGLRLGFHVDDIRETRRVLEEPATPKQTPWGLRAVVRDPDGRIVDLVQR